MRVAVILASLVLAGCVDTAPLGVPSEAPPVAVPSLSFLEPIPALACTTTCHEPTIAVDRSGRIFVADGATGLIAVSTDDGASWTTHQPPPLPVISTGPLGTQMDVLLQVAPSGRLYWSAIVFSSVYDYTAIQIAWSDDGAVSWAGNVHLSAIDGTKEVSRPDRQWLGFSPDGTMYLTYNQVPTGIWIAHSADGGKTWAGWTRAVPVEGRPADGLAGPPVIDRAGRVHVAACASYATAADPALSPALVYTSEDGGATFRSVATELPCDMFPMLTVAPDDTLVLTTRHAGVGVVRSVDGGRTFSAPQAWGDAGATSSTWPIVRADGVLDIMWYAAGESGADVVVSRGTPAGGPIARVIVGQVTHSSFQIPGERYIALTDFAHATRLLDGRLVLVWVNGADGIIMLGVENTK